METILSIRNLHKYFHLGKGSVLKAVNSVNLELKRGETLGLVGESGCGKTTLGRTIVKIYKPDSGNIFFEGEDIWSLDRKQAFMFRKKAQMIYQDPYASLDPLSVISTSVAEGLVIHKMRQSEAGKRKRVLELLEMVGLNPDHANRFPHEFSGGQRQRIGIARALAVEPHLVVCDEPISALDVSIQAQIINLLMRMQREMGLSYIFISHDLSMIKQISDRIAVMYLGNIVELATSDTLYEKQRHPYTKALLSAIPIPEPKIERERKRVMLSGDVPSPINLPDICGFSKRCSVAKEECFKSRPELREVEQGHFVACHMNISD